MSYMWLQFLWMGGGGRENSRISIAKNKDRDSEWLPPFHCVTLSTLLSLSEPQFLHLWNEIRLGNLQAHMMVGEILENTGIKTLVEELPPWGASGVNERYPSPPPHPKGRVLRPSFWIHSKGGKQKWVLAQGLWTDYFYNRPKVSQRRGLWEG